MYSSGLEILSVGPEVEKLRIEGNVYWKLEGILDTVWRESGLGLYLCVRAVNMHLSDKGG